MDVHNDLWKKDQGLDFGDRPRDIYDNNLSYLDEACARFFQRLKSKGLYDRFSMWSGTRWSGATSFKSARFWLPTWNRSCWAIWSRWKVEPICQ